MTADKRGKLGQPGGEHYSLFHLRERRAGRTQKKNKLGKARRITILQVQLRAYGLEIFPHLLGILGANFLVYMYIIGHKAQDAGGK